MKKPSSGAWDSRFPRSLAGPRGVPRVVGPPIQYLITCHCLNAAGYQSERDSKYPDAGHR
eukprot:scaffold22634_cov123-Cylindrotheca_fusiformis.AAC.11